MSGPTAQPRGSKRLRWLAGVGAAALGLALCHHLLISVFVVSGVSMDPSLDHGQRVLVLKQFQEVSPGDVLVFKNPHNPQEVLIKRVLAVGGQEIEARAGKLFVGSSLTAEPYVKPGTSLGTMPPTLVPDGHVFLVGDNRSESIDSRQFGAVEQRLIVGKVLWP